MIQFSSNPTIKIGVSYDTSKFMLGDILNTGLVELIPLLSQSDFNKLLLNTNNKIGYKIYNTTEKLLYQWNGSSWNIINDTAAGYLISNTSNKQTKILISNSNPPISGQVLVAVNSTKATWQNQSGGGGTRTDNITLGDTFSTNQCFKLINGLAQKITSIDTGAPYIDGITLESGSSGQSILVCMLMQSLYNTPLTLPSGRNLFLSQTGIITNIIPTKIAGDKWLVIAARENDTGSFMFSPSRPIQLK